MIDHKNIKYMVNLVNGDIMFSTQNKAYHGPYKCCDNLYEADLYSLNVLRQNFLEDRSKKGKDGVWTTSFLRSVLGQSDEHTYEAVIDSIEYIKKNCPEQLI